MKTLLLAVVFALSTSGVSAAYDTYGYGADPCGQWLDKTNTTLTLMRRSWILGSLSTWSAAFDMLAQTENHPKSFLTSDGNTDTAAIFAWVDTYCQEHQFKILDNAVQAFVTASLVPSMPVAAQARPQETVALFASLASAETVPPVKGWTYGWGGLSCKKWVTASETFPKGQWVLGYVSATTALAAEPLAHADVYAQTAWVTNYCTEHPLDDVQTATDRLVDELVSRAKRDTVERGTP